jgi:uncharacterized protein
VLERIQLAAPLRTVEAVISGEALVLPARTLTDRPEPLPRAEDPSLAPW